MTHTTPDNVCPRCGKRNPAEIHTCIPPDALLSVPAGWKLVPIEPTGKMIDAGIFAYRGFCEESYVAMVKAAPPPPDAAPNGWISVADRLPEEYVSVLIAMKDGHVDKTCLYRGEFLRPSKEQPTHWQPLPKPPAAPQDSPKDLQEKME
jgi:hypothetical protein